LKIIRDFEAAKSALSRSILAEPQETHSSVKNRIKEIFSEELSIQQAVERILNDVRSGGDAALLSYAKKIDGVELTDLEVSPEEIIRSYSKVDKDIISAMELAADKIRSFHLKHMQRSSTASGKGGIGQLVRPLERIGLYVPGGTASYPSTVLMTAIPARVAGVGEVIVVTPPGQDRTIPPVTLAASYIAGVDRIFKVGGAQAVAALAFGTESVPKVDKICGPGNIFVQQAKRMVYGEVGIDGLYGPTETIIIADDTANPSVCAADLLAQAEHDQLATAILITTSSELAGKVDVEVANRLSEMKRKQIAMESIENRGYIIVVQNMEKAIELANLYAPEHLSLIVTNAELYVEKIKNAGGIFIGEESAETIGDYVAGPSHVMPTGGTASFGSPLTVDDFLKVTSVVAIDKKTLKELGPAAAAIARVEGLSEHARAVDIRLQQS
jgi:histidinol dehydrogenase